MSRTLYISRSCPHCKKLLIGIHKYEFLRPMFIFIDVGTQQYPDYIKSVPTLVIDQNMIKADDVFGYLNNMVEQIFEQHPELKQKYHPEQQLQQQQPQQNQQQHQHQHQQQHQQQQQFPSENNAPEKPGKGPDYDPVDDLVGWCPDGGCTFSDISEQNDDCSKQMVSLQDNMFSAILEENDQMSIQQPQKVPMEQDNSQFQKSAKQQQMDSSYERLMAERNLIK
jgi:hypothetical protein